ncbi:hypothetical protein POPTR_002G076001v4 [Populus trichocarpa]|uniref:Uncharacterized protein n=1 Tax=Populus trichocarpa TaxID=3694 RepID=A0ACC0TCN7_POPTR|nr:hypothetical protein POPTR_002G076001v4 [Populus trichocarpa]
MDDEYEKLFRRLNPPRVVIDNEACKNAIVIREYYIKHIDGSPVKLEAERQRIIQCLEAAIERRVSEKFTRMLVQNAPFKGQLAIGFSWCTNIQLVGNN